MLFGYFSSTRESNIPYSIRVNLAKKGWIMYGIFIDLNKGFHALRQLKRVMERRKER
jgi:hypothetical protein